MGQIPTLIVALGLLPSVAKAQAPFEPAVSKDNPSFDGSTDQGRATDHETDSTAPKWQPVDYDGWHCPCGHPTHSPPQWGNRTAAARLIADCRTSASAMRDRVDQPKASKAQQADKNQGNGVYEHAMPIIILAFWAFIF
jgi:hypothetical protein